MLFPRISGIVGHDISLEMQFFLNGVKADPYCIKRIDIYRASVATENKIAEILISDCGSSSYPSPLTRFANPTASGGGLIAGAYTYLWTVPRGLQVPDKYYDVWRYIGTDPEETTSVSDDDESDEDQWQYNCGEFWLYPSSWYADDLLENLTYDFEPVSLNFRKGEYRPIEVGIIPTPLYNYNYNLSMKIIPHLSPTISIWTLNNEAIVEDAPMEIGLREGYYYDHPFVLRYNLDLSDSTFHIATYKYRVKVVLPNGNTIVSTDKFFTVN